MNVVSETMKAEAGYWLSVEARRVVDSTGLVAVSMRCGTWAGEGRYTVDSLAVALQIALSGLMLDLEEPDAFGFNDGTRAASMVEIESILDKLPPAAGAVAP